MKPYVVRSDDFGSMLTIDGLEPCILATQSQPMCKGHSASSSIPAKGTLLTIRIEINHPEVEVRMMTDQDKTVGTNPETPVTKVADKRLLLQGKGFIPVIDHDEIVSRTMIFRKSGFQTLFLLNIVKISKYL
jgi:hypothetical protein